MTSGIYELIGRLVVWFVRRRYRTQLRIASAVSGGAVLLAGVLLAKRQPPEG